MSNNTSNFFEKVSHYGHKEVTWTDIKKSAYVPNSAQREAFERAGIKPVPSDSNRVIDIIVLATNEVLQSSYYYAFRQDENRVPEVRIGRALVKKLCVEDQLYLGVDGKTIYVEIVRSNPKVLNKPSEGDQLFLGLDGISKNEETVRVESHVTHIPSDIKSIIERARNVVGKESRSVTSDVFERNEHVKKFAHERSQFKCEMPGCNWKGFLKENGEQYIEVHHIDALGQDGEDVIYNVAALCANCHKMAHYSQDLANINKVLKEIIKLRTDDFLKKHSNL